MVQEELPRHLDLTSGGNMGSAHARAFQIIAKECEDEYTALVDRLSELYGSSIDWWVTDLASRNTYASGLYENYAKARYALSAAHRGVVDTILVDSPQLCRTIRSGITGTNAKVACTGSWLARLRVPARAARRYSYAVLGALVSYVAAWLTGPRDREYTDSLTLVDSFVTESSFAGGVYRDRYYEGFGGLLEGTALSGIVYLPTYLFGIGETRAIIRQLRCSQQPRFLIKEDWLRPTDYLRAFAHPFFALRFFPRRTQHEGVDVTPLLRHAWLENLGSRGTISSLLTYRLMGRLRKRGVGVRAVLDWFENQNIDKGLHAGVHRFYRGTPSVGYQGFIQSDSYLCAFPTGVERDGGVLPKRVAVCGEALVDRAKRYCADLDVFAAPAFRFAAVHKSGQRRSDSRGEAALVALSASATTDASILRLASVLQELDPEIRFKMRAHPAGRPAASTADRFGIELPEGARDDTGSYEEALERADIVVTSGSSVGLEAICHGALVLVAGNLGGITRSAIPANAPEGMFRVCYDREDVAASLEEYRARLATLSLDERHDQAVDFASRYFKPVDRQSSMALLSLTGSEPARDV